MDDTEILVGGQSRLVGSIGTPAAIEELRQMYREPIGNFHEWTVAEAALRSLGLGDGG